MRRLSLILLVLIFMGSHSSMGAVISDEMQMSASRLGQENSTGYLGYLAYPRSSGLDVRGSFLLGMKVEGSNKPEQVSLCKSISDDTCKEMNYFTVSAVLPTCNATLVQNCVADFFVKSSTGTQLEVIKVGSFSKNEPNYFDGDDVKGIPEGSSPTLYRIPGAPHEAGDLYLLLATRSGHWNKGDSRMTEFDNTSIALYAVKVINGTFQVFQPSVSVADYQIKNQINTFGSDSNCVYNDATACAVAYPLPTNISFGVTVNYSSLKENWFHGRVVDPLVQVVSGSNGVKVTIEAKAIKSTGFFVLKKKEELPASILDAQNKKIGKGSCTENSEDASCYDSNLWQTDEAMSTFLEWLDIAEDKATFDPTIWNINAMNQGLEHPRASICAPQSGDLVGMVSTNATQYIAGPPSFNTASSELEYKVAAPHLRADGSLFRGSYDLAMNADYARCLYGIKNGEVKASISVTSESGVAVAATAVQGIKAGWLYLSAKNFTFSSPTIKVKLEAEKSQNKTITCVKGKKIKKVSAVKPQCPKGYKKA